jgi:hypothetical protein
MVETERQMIDRHIATGEGLIAEHHSRIEMMMSRGEPLASAEALLLLLVASQSLYLEHLLGTDEPTASRSNAFVRTLGTIC